MAANYLKLNTLSLIEFMVAIFRFEETPEFHGNRQASI